MNAAKIFTEKPLKVIISALFLSFLLIVIFSGILNKTGATALDGDHMQDASGVNTSVTNQVIRKGWGFMPGNGLFAIEDTPIDYGITFDELPFLIVKFANSRQVAEGDPADLSECTVTRKVIAAGVNQATNGFKPILRTPTGLGFPSVTNYCYTWIAIGRHDASYAGETDPVFSGWDKSAGINITESQIVDLTHFTNNDETDQVFTASVAAGISLSDITNWNESYGWGDHSLIGYDMSDDSWSGTGDVFTTSGNVGIGTSSPTSLLDVEGDAKIGGELQVDAIHGGGQTQMIFGSMNTKSSPNVPIPIPDNFPPGISDTIEVPDFGPAKNLIVSVNIGNSDISGLHVSLRDPNNDVYVLWCGINSNFPDCTDSSTSTKLVTSYPEPTLPASGDLSTWVGNNPQGNWNLFVIDSQYYNNTTDGQIRSWSISVLTHAGDRVQVWNGDLSVDNTLRLKTMYGGEDVRMAFGKMITETSSNTPIAIPDNSPVGVSDTLTFPDLGISRKVIVSVSISKTTTTISDLRVSLTDPFGDEHVLWCGDETGFSGCNEHDSATSLITSYPEPTQLFSGDLSTFIGTNPKGNWTLKVIDGRYYDNDFSGHVNSWSLSSHTEEGSTVQVWNGNFVVDGNIGVGTSDPISRLMVSDGYLQLDVSSGSPPAGDCDESSEKGRMKVDDTSTDLYVCTASGWITK